MKNKKKVFGVLGIILIVFTLILTIFILNNISLNGYISFNGINRITINNSKKSVTMDKDNEEFDSICSILKKNKVQLSTSKIYLYDDAKNIVIENTLTKKQHALYFYYGIQDEYVTVIVKDYFENCSTPFKLDHPYYLLVHITFEDYNKIFSR